MSTKSKVLLALADGIVSGLAIGLLLAPEKGSETRKTIRRKIQKLQDEISGNKAEERMDQTKS